MIGSVFLRKPGKAGTTAVRELAKSRSDRSTATVFLTIGKATLVCNGRQARGLAEALLRHVEHLGPAREDLLVYDEVLAP